MGRGRRPALSSLSDPRSRTKASRSTQDLRAPGPKKQANLGQPTPRLPTFRAQRGRDNINGRLASSAPPRGTSTTTRNTAAVVQYPDPTMQSRGRYRTRPRSGRERPIAWPRRTSGLPSQRGPRPRDAANVVRISWSVRSPRLPQRRGTPENSAWPYFHPADRCSPIGCRQ